MNQSTSLAIAAVLTLATMPAAWAKGAITKIIIDGQDLDAPLEITDPATLSRFTIWSGPGVGRWDMLRTIPRPGDPTFIVDWTQGIVEDAPAGSRRYRVTLHIEGREAPRDTYEVVYVIDDVDDPGYVYLPANEGDGFGRWNTFQIYRGVEGHWFRSAAEWEALARALLDPE